MAMIKCEDCGKEYSDKAVKCPNCGCPNPNIKQEYIPAPQKGVWSSGRLTIGILSIVLFVIVAFQSCGAGAVNALGGSDSTSGSQGFILAICMLIAGIVAICTRNARSKIATIIPTIFYWFGGLFTLMDVGFYKDLEVWGGISFIFGLVFVLAAIKTKK